MAERREDHEGLTGASKVALTAIAAGLGLGGIVHRQAIKDVGSAGKTFARRKMAQATESVYREMGRPEYQMTMERLSAFSKASIHSVGDNTGLRSTARFLNPRHSEAFENSFRRAFRANMAQPKGQYHNVPEGARRIDEMLLNRKEIGKQARTVVRHDFLKQEIASNPILQAINGENNRLLGLLQQKKHKSLLAKPGQERFERFMHENTIRTDQMALQSKESKTLKSPILLKDEKEEKDFFQAMQDALQNVESKMEKANQIYKKTADGSEVLPGDRIGAVANAMRVASYRGLKKTLNPENTQTFLSKAMAENGMRQATMDDAIRLNILESDPLVDRIGGRKIATNYVKRLETEAARYGESYDDIKGLTLDPHLFVGANDEIVDMRGAARSVDQFFDFQQQHFQIPFLNFNIFDLMQHNVRKGIKDAPLTQMFEAGEIHPFIRNAERMTENYHARNANAASTPLAQNYFYAGGDVYDLNKLMGLSNSGMSKNQVGGFLDEAMIDTGLRLASAEYGIPKRMVESMAGLTAHDRKPNRVRDFLGFGQESESIAGRMGRFFSKFDKPEYGPNITKSLQGADISTVEGVSHVKSLYNHATDTLNRTSRNLSADSRNAIYDDLSHSLNQSYMGLDINLHDLQDPETILDTVQLVLQRSKNTDAFTSGQKGIQAIEGRLRDLWDNGYKNNRSYFHRQTRMLAEKEVMTSEMWSALAIGRERVITSTDDMLRELEMIGMAQYDEINKNKGGLKELLGSKLMSNEISQQGFDETIRLDSLRRLEGYREGMNAIDLEESTKAASAFHEDISNNLQLRGQVNYSLRQADPAMGVGPGDELDSLLGEGVRFTGFRQYKTMGSAYQEQLETSNNALSLYAKTPVNWIKQFGAGRNNLEDVTMGTMGSFFMTSRLDDALSQYGLGLPNHLRGSAQSILFNQWGRRIVLPYVAYQQAMYLDGMTGDFFSDTAADGYVNMHQDLNTLKEMTGLNKIGKGFTDVMPGFNQIGEWPINKAFNFLTLGAFSDFRSGDEVQEYYESGEDAIRKGRYWGVGSTTPWVGGKIERWQPNWYRRAKSDYKFTDSQYGSEGEYWANHWMPTLTHPLAPIKHFLTDPYHYENKHKDDRPFAVTGGFSEINQIPIVGPVVDSLVSKVLKPEKTNPKLRKAHREYLEQYNERLSGAYLEMNSGSTIQGMPSGGSTFQGTNVNVDYTGDTYAQSAGAENGEDLGYGVSEDTLEAAESVAMGGEGSGVGGVSGRTGGTQGYLREISGMNRSVTAGDMGNVDLAAMNEKLAAGANNSGGKSISNLDSLRDPNTLYNLNDAINANNLTDIRFGALRDVWYNASETAGMFGFLGKTGVGFSESGRGATLESSERMSSYNKAFWDMELGGFGGDVSEIFRRYVARDPNKNYYNPIRNTMPEWLPGAEYFTDFLHGDPYSKVSAGLMRLPGDSYETLYDVKKGADGTYSALDRLRVLGDIAPYSDQYRMARKEVSLLNQNGLLSEDDNEEYKTIREQVSAKKKKNYFTPRRFTDNDVDYQHVTVTQVIDQNTFLTEEYGENPIKLAGVHVKSDDTEKRALIEQFIKPGQELKIAIDADPLRQVRKDMMNTIRAVVYTPQSEEGSMFGTMGIGSGANLNYALANRGGLFYGENKVSIKDDKSAIATHALFSRGQKTLGSFNETLTHDILPAIPVLGVFADKFLQVRSPVEAYKRNLYGSTWRDWADPISGWLIPAVQTMTERNPVVAAAEGYGLGLIAGRQKRGITAMAAGLTVGALATWRTLMDVGNEVIPGGETWIPKRREKEREYDEYFDKIKYMKYRGLYERAKKMAKEKEGIDLDEYFADREEVGQKNKGFKKYLNDQKKWLSISKKSGYGDKEATQAQIKDINDALNEMNEDRPVTNLGEYATLALRYKDESESTLYGADESGDFRKIYRALPNKDRQFFTEFLKATPKEREEILRLVPKNQRTLYQSKFGMKVDEKETLQSFMADKYVPDANWEGWRPEVSLDDIKVKVLKNEGMELTESNYWDDDEKRAEENGTKAIDIYDPKMFRGLDTRAIENILSGAGLHDVRVTMTRAASEQPQITSQIFLSQDRRDELVQKMNENIGSLFG